MSTERRSAAEPVVRVDLGHRGGRPQTPVALEARVREALARTPAAGTRCFLVLDDAPDLMDHQVHYERLYSHGPAEVLCLAYGGADSRELLLPHVLRAAGVLWIPDAFAGADGTEPGPGEGRGGGGARRGDGPGSRSGKPGPEAVDEALRPMVELLSELSVFRAVLGGIAEVPHGVAVPAARVLEHDLTEEAKARAWRQALEELTGQDVPPPALVVEGAPGSDAGPAVPAALGHLIGAAVPRALAGRNWLVPGGRAETRRLACERALRDAEDGYEQVRGPAGLFGRRGRTVDLPERLADLADALGAYRGCVAEALSEGGGDRLSAEQRSGLLQRGIDLPELPEASRSAVGPGLRAYTERLIAAGLPLRSVAARLGALSDRSAPAGSAARLARLDDICPERMSGELASPLPFGPDGPAFAHAAPVLLLAFTAGLWPGPGWVAGPLTGLLLALLTLLMLRRRPNRSPARPLDGGGSTRSGLRLVAGLAGGAAGGLAGTLLAPPVWAGAAALGLAVTGSVALVLRDWTAAVDDWWDRTDVRSAARSLHGIDGLLAETAVQDWLFADARYHCSDGARAVALLVRGLADTAEECLAAEDAGAAGARGSAGANGMAASAVSSGADAGTADDPWNWVSWGDGDGHSHGDGNSHGVGGDGHGGGPPRDGGPPTGRTAPWDGGAAADTLPSGAPADPPWLERERGDGGPALVPTLLGDLAGGATRILATRWAAVERDPAEAGRGSVRRPMAELLEEERAGLRRDGATSPPVSSAGPGERPEERPGAAELLGVSSDRAGRLLGPDGGADEVVPLCSAEHRRMLSREPTAVRGVRFAPEAMRRGAEPDLPRDGWHAAGEDIVWTPGGRHAGVLCLVPLRAEIVRTVRAEEGEPR
ncbi:MULTISPECIES: hypothetical protein [Streptomyces]|uniref:Uncharacterized protein n=1 Tax=Streptomyces fradiae TaxID=1906 RepID=A0ACC4WCT5_STRFR|nr:MULTISPECIES: hypothetical protein [Streptomyces]KNE82449.1 hypothetical protein ADZ36_10380 [Streptomyces fradiae]OFA49491.1 hypothetical protein BEN35_17895 [Streptomyces fradiae]